MAKTEKDINKLLDQFNKLDTSPMKTRDYVLGLEQAKSGVKNLTKKEADRLFPEKLTDEDIENLRAAREQEVALKRGLIAANEARPVSKRIRTIAKAGKLNSGLKGLNFFNKESDIQKEQQEELEKLKQEFQPTAQVIKKSAESAKVSPEPLDLKSSLKNLPIIKQLQEEFSEGKAKDSKDSANFDYDFLITPEGKLQKDPLLDILISTWNEGYDAEKEIEEQRKEQKRIAEENDSSNGISLLDMLMGIGLFKLIKLPMLLAKKGFKAFVKTKFGKAVLAKFRGFVNKAIKFIKAPFVWVFDKIKNGISSIYNKVSKWAKSAFEAAKNFMKNAITKVSGWWKSAMSSIENFWNMCKTKSAQILEKARQGAAKLWEEAKAAWNKGKEFLRKAEERASKILGKAGEAIKSGANKAKNLVTKGIKSVKETGSKVKNVAVRAAKSGVNKTKDLAKATKKVANITTKTAGKLFTKGAVAIEAILIANDIKNEMEETGLSHDQAMKSYLDKRNNEGWSPLDVIDPVKIGLALKADVVAEGIIDKAFDFFSDSPAERFRKAQLEAEKRLRGVNPEDLLKKEGNPNSGVIDSNISQPKELENPNFRYREKSEEPIQPVTIIQTPSGIYEGDGDTIPYYGFGYSGAY